jgi:hypothetical protein
LVLGCWLAFFDSRRYTWIFGSYYLNCGRHLALVLVTGRKYNCSVIIGFI